MSCNCSLIKSFGASVFILALASCSSHQERPVQGPTLFTKMSATETGIGFANNVSYTEEFNPYTFRNFFNGGGVAIGDINNDGLPDVFMGSNQQSNRLYLNKGNFKFEDITDKAGVSSSEVWSTGITMVDVNGDGWLDIYVCKSGDLEGGRRNNELFINNGDLTFTEKGVEYNLAAKGLATHAAFFDYDNDGDLDCYLLNNSFKSVGNFDLVRDQRNIPDSLGGNKMFRNDGDRFTDVTIASGIYSSRIGFGLGVTISDINHDGWQDIYISNDFFERDYLYINKKNGTFDESLEQYIHEISMNSMGADVADINNDTYPDIYVTDMFPEDPARLKTNTNFENWNKYQSNLQTGYYKQFVRNSLQLNSGAFDKNAPGFAEISRLSGTSATDWSWGALITDLDNDGFKDIFVANGIARDITDQDYIQYAANQENVIRKQILNKEKNIVTRLVDIIPSNPIPNYAFHNKGNLTFADSAQRWGLGEKSFSNGSAYGDLDNDGDLDLVVNNLNMPCFVYRNETSQQHPENKYLKVALKGVGKNSFAIGSKVTVHYNGTVSWQEMMPMRGFESTVDCRLNFGLGKTNKIDSVVVEWPDGKVSSVKGVQPGQLLTLSQTDAVARAKRSAIVSKKVFKTSTTSTIDFTHKENAFVDFDRDRLIFHMLSTQGPRFAKGDINNDGLEDIYVGGAKDQAGVMYQQTKGGKFVKVNEDVFARDAVSEDTDAVFFDADNDGDQDLYVCSGGNEFQSSSSALINRLYINNKGRFTRSDQVLPSFLFESVSCARPADFDGDGDLDLFVGVRLKPFGYGQPCKGYILQNDKGTFTDVTDIVAPELKQTGMITDAAWMDYDHDKKMDLIVTGEYMPIRVFRNDNNSLKETTESVGLGKSNGWWNRIQLADLNNDGFMDIVAANHGLNSRFKANENEPISLYSGDFDNNGTLEQIVTCYSKGTSYPMVLRQDLLSALPALKKKYLKYESYKGQTITDIFTKQQLDAAVRMDAYELRTSVIMNNGDGTFTLHALPTEAQLAPMFGILVNDFDGDGALDILLGGNFYESKPEVGIYDASYGVLLKGSGRGNFETVPATKSGLAIRGAVRDMMLIGKKVFVAKNNDRVEVLEF